MTKTHQFNPITYSLLKKLRSKFDFYQRLKRERGVWGEDTTLLHSIYFLKQKYLLFLEDEFATLGYGLLVSRITYFKYGYSQFIVHIENIVYQVIISYFNIFWRWKDVSNWWKIIIYIVYFFIICRVMLGPFAW